MSSFPLSRLTTILSLKSSPPSDPLTLLLTVKNTHPSQPITLLRWSSPLDRLALPLGLVAITAADGQDVPFPVIMANRKMPPQRERDLVTLGPGEEEVNEVKVPVEREMLFGKGKDGGEGEGEGKAKFVCKGRWMAVWPGLRKEDVDEGFFATGGRAFDDESGAGGDGKGMVSGEWDPVLLEVGR